MVFVYLAQQMTRGQEKQKNAHALYIYSFYEFVQPKNWGTNWVESIWSLDSFFSYAF